MAQALYPLAKVQHVQLECEHAGFCWEGWNCLWALVPIHHAPLCLCIKIHRALLCVLRQMYESQPFVKISTTADLPLNIYYHLIHNAQKFLFHTLWALKHFIVCASSTHCNQWPFHQCLHFNTGEMQLENSKWVCLWVEMYCIPPRPEYCMHMIWCNKIVSAHSVLTNLQCKVTWVD